MVEPCDGTAVENENICSGDEEFALVGSDDEDEEPQRMLSIESDDEDLGCDDMIDDIVKKYQEKHGIDGQMHTRLRSQ